MTTTATRQPIRRSLVGRHPITAFLLLAYSLTVAVVVIPFPEEVGGALENIVGVAVPAFVVTALVGGVGGVRDLLRRCMRWRVPLRWYAIAVTLPPVVLVITPALYGQAPLHALAGNWSLLFTSFLPTFVFFVVLDTLPEEAGATGFLFSRLQHRYGPMRAVLLTSAFFWLWHVPSAVRDSGTRVALTELLIFLLVGHLASRVLAGWLYNATGASVLIVGIFHAMFNATVNPTGLGVAVLGLQQLDVLLLVTGFLALVAATIAVVTRGRLCYRPGARAALPAQGRGDDQ